MSASWLKIPKEVWKSSDSILVQSRSSSLSEALADPIVTNCDAVGLLPTTSKPKVGSGVGLLVGSGVGLGLFTGGFEGGLLVDVHVSWRLENRRMERFPTSFLPCRPSRWVPRRLFRRRPGRLACWLGRGAATAAASTRVDVYAGPTTKIRGFEVAPSRICLSDKSTMKFSTKRPRTTHRSHTSSLIHLYSADTRAYTPGKSS